MAVSEEDFYCVHGDFDEFTADLNVKANYVDNFMHSFVGSEQLLQREHYGSYPVTVIDNARIPMESANICLAVKVWFPKENLDGTVFQQNCHFTFKKGNNNSASQRETKISEAEKFPVILEYIPYRKSDLTAGDDFGKYSWFCSYGYVCLRVDIRGTGRYHSCITLFVFFFFFV